MPSQRLQELFSLYYNGIATNAELEELKQLIRQTGDASLIDMLNEEWEALKNPDQQFQSPNIQLLKSILTKSGVENAPMPVISKTPVRSFTKKYISYAAAVLFLLAGAGVYTWLPEKPVQPATEVVKKTELPKDDALPGTNKATLTLGDGSVIELDSTDQKIISTKEGATISVAGEKLVYVATNSDSKIIYNTMKTPRGGQYKLTLSDGTNVWLNAASSITYPTVFNGEQRNVSITGEAYFEVAKNPQKPFVVKINDNAGIRVLGTHFNVNAYTDEPQVNTTLLEGKVMVNAGTKSQQLDPGQQSQLSRNGNLKLLRNADLQQAVAWKDGIFNFRHTKLEVLMRQLSRWYDVEVEYPNGVPDLEFGGKVQRTLPLSKLLEGLGEMDVKFRIEEGRRLIVLK